MGVERRGSIVQLGLEKTTGKGRIGLKQAKPFSMQRLDNWSRMNREIHVRFSESLRGQISWATRLEVFQRICEDCMIQTFIV